MSQEHGDAFSALCRAVQRAGLDPKDAVRVTFEGTGQAGPWTAVLRVTVPAGAPAAEYRATARAKKDAKREAAAAALPAAEAAPRAATASKRARPAAADAPQEDEASPAKRARVSFARTPAGARDDKKPWEPLTMVPSGHSPIESFARLQRWLQRHGLGKRLAAESAPPHCTLSVRTHEGREVRARGSCAPAEGQKAKEASRQARANAAALLHARLWESEGELETDHLPRYAHGREVTVTRDPAEINRWALEHGRAGGMLGFDLEWNSYWNFRGKGRQGHAPARVMQLASETACLVAHLDRCTGANLWQTLDVLADSRVQKVGRSMQNDRRALAARFGLDPAKSCCEEHGFIDVTLGTTFPTEVPMRVLTSRYLGTQPHPSKARSTWAWPLADDAVQYAACDAAIVFDLRRRIVADGK